MGASDPTARSAHAFLNFTDQPLYMFLARLVLLYKTHPTDPLIAREGSEAFPDCQGFLVRCESFSNVWGQQMDRPARDRLLGHNLALLQST